MTVLTTLPPSTASAPAFSGLDMRETFNDVLARLATQVRHLAGYVYAEEVAGVSWGTGKTSAVRQANYTALQAAIDSTGTGGANAGKIWVWPIARTVEIEGGKVVSGRNAGLNFPAGCGGMIGSMESSRLVQYSTTHGCVSFGAGPGTLIGAVTFDGLRVSMGVTGGTNSAGFLFGAAFLNKFRNLSYDAYGAGGGAIYPDFGYDHISGTTFFSNEFSTLQVGGGKSGVYRKLVEGTGNVYNNTYLGGGNLSQRTPISNSVFRLENGANDVFNQLNLEWCIVNLCDIMNIGNVRNLTINTLHIEGIKATGAYGGTVMNTSGAGAITINGMMIYNYELNSTDYSGTGALVFKNYLDMYVKVTAFRWYRDNVTHNKAITLFTDEPTTKNNFNSSLRIENLVTSGVTNGFVLDSSLSLGTFGDVYAVGTYTYRKWQSETDGALVRFPSGNNNILAYGAHKNLTIQIDTPITTDRKVLMQSTLAAANLGLKFNRLANDTLRVIRSGNATGAFNILIRDAADTTTYATLSAVNTDAVVGWTGSAPIV